jgi:hypothetical protein
MSFLDDIVDFAGGILSSNSIGANLAKTALLGYGLNKVTSSVNRDNARPATAQNSTQPDPGVRLQVNPDPSHKIPVLYGTAYTGGIVTDAVLSDSNQTLTTVFTICERTGVKMSDSVQSAISFGTILMNDQRLVFKADGVTVDYSVDREGNVDRSLDGLMTVRCYSGGSASGFNVAPTGYSITPVNAYGFVPNWTSSFTMNDLVFACVQMTYSSAKNLTAIPNMRFQLTNTMTLPGDVMYDYMTNTRYGCGIDPTEIYSA